MQVLSGSSSLSSDAVADVAFRLEPADVPRGYSHAEFVVRPLTTADTELDYAAVMASRDQLRVWEQDTWPEDDFTMEANRGDLQRHQDLHDEGLAFTYTVMSPDETECLGCIYLFPPEARFLARSEVTPLAGERWGDVDAAVYHWVRTSLVGTGFDRAVFASLADWMRDDWPIDRSVFVTSEDLSHQVDLIESVGMTQRYVIQEPDKPGRYLAYGAA